MLHQSRYDPKSWIKILIVASIKKNLEPTYDIIFILMLSHKKYYFGNWYCRLLRGIFLSETHFVLRKGSDRVVQAAEEEQPHLWQP